MTDTGHRTTAPPPTPGAAPSDVLPVVGLGWARRLRPVAAMAYVAVLTFVVVHEGVPTGRPTVGALVVTGLLIASIGQDRRAVLRVLVDWLPFTLVLMLYDRTRAVADAIGLPLHEADVVGWETSLFGGRVPSVWLQEHFYDPDSVHWYDAVMTLVYTSHFLLTPVLAAVLWWWLRPAWVRYIRRVVLLSVAGLLTYVVLPEAPPWLAARDGVLGAPVERLSARGWIWLHAGDVREALDKAQQDGSNPVAAMPSLHFAFAVLATLFLAARVGRRWRPVLYAYPLLMGLALVYLGEHYVLDLVVGGAYALAVHVGAGRWERTRDRRPRHVVASPA